MNFNETFNQLQQINQNIQENARRALELRLQDQEWNVIKKIFSIKSFKYLIFSPLCFLFSLLIVLLLCTGIHFHFTNIPSEKFTLSFLENEEMNTIYVYIFLTLSVITWNIFLFFVTIIFKCKFADLIWSPHNKNPDLNISDLIYFNPVVFCFVVYIYNTNYFKSGLDTLFWAFYSNFMYIGFCFTVSLYKYGKIKMSQISNTLLEENLTLMNKLRRAYIFLFLTTLSYVYLVLGFLEEVDWVYRYILLFKGVFLIFKQIEFYMINDMEYKFIYWGANSKEDKYMNNLSLKTKIQLTNLFLILHKLILGLYSILSAKIGYYLVFPILVVIISAFYSIYSVYTSYANMKRFYKRLDTL